MPKYNQVDKLEKQRRLTSVKEWILAGWDSQAIVMQGEATWKIQERQVYRYIADAHVQFKKEGNPDYEMNKARHLSARRRLLRNLKGQDTSKGARAALSIWDSMARIEGVLIERAEVEIKTVEIEESRKKKA